MSATLTPVVSVIIACFNSELYVAAALDAVRTQTLSAIEIIVIDDASTDQTVEIVTELASQDPRISLLRLPANVGPAVARNKGLQAARGRWIAIVDSDDLIARCRLQKLVAAAEADGADIACDNLVLFRDDARAVGRALEGKDWTEPRGIDLVTFIRSNHANAGQSALGYLQPIIRTEFIRRSGVAYNEDLLLNEDYDLLLRMLAAGARMRVYPWPTYYYRKRETSLSRRYRRTDLQAMIAANAAFLRCQAAQSSAVARALAERLDSIVDEVAFIDFKAALSARDVGSALAKLWARPQLVPLLLGKVGFYLERRTQDLRSRSGSSPRFTFDLAASVRTATPRPGRNGPGTSGEA
ncbi:glycosyltransferase family 2 protein [Alsobacter sp. SYSU BS001988]